MHIHAKPILCVDQIKMSWHGEASADVCSYGGALTKQTTPCLKYNWDVIDGACPGL